MIEQIENKMLELFKDVKVRFNYNSEFVEYDEGQGHIHTASFDEILKAKTKANIKIIKDDSFKYLNGLYFCNYDRDGIIHNDRLRFVG